MCIVRGGLATAVEYEETGSVKGGGGGRGLSAWYGGGLATGVEYEETDPCWGSIACIRHSYMRYFCQCAEKR